MGQLFHAGLADHRLRNQRRFESIERLVRAQSLGQLLVEKYVASHSVNTEQRYAQAVGLYGNQRGPDFLFRSGNGLLRLANEFGELAHGARFKQDCKFQVHLPGLLDLRKQSHAHQRMTAQPEEVVVEFHFLDSQQVLPPGDECPLNAFTRRRGLVCYGLRRCPSAACVQLIKGLRNGNHRSGSRSKQNANQRPRALARRNSRQRGDFDGQLPSRA